jgi:Nucleotidyltransferase domain
MESYPTLELSNRIGQRWLNIEAARMLSRETLSELREVLSDSDSDDSSIVVSGSLGREEFTPGSDIDWMLLLDGIADPNHHALFLDAKQKIEPFALKREGREGTFGAIVSSHDLIHNIGGEDDTNKNLTRRLLLLLESQPVGRSAAHERVVKNILKRYLLDDFSFWHGTSVHRHHIPHFLLNDFARFWRTMAVDFAYKFRARSGEGWAIRNIKLRMSRKLLYAAGLLGCFRCHLQFLPELRDTVYDDEDLRPEILDIAHMIFSARPLDIVASFLLHLDQHDHLGRIALMLFGAYDEFLGILNDAEQRKRLEALEAGSQDALYDEARNISHRFRDALLELFFDETTELASLTRLYGVF